MSLKHVLKAGTLGLVLLVGGLMFLGCGGDSGTKPPTGDQPGRDTRLITQEGWAWVTTITDGGYSIRVAGTLSAAGIFTVYVEMMPGMWVEEESGAGTWYTIGNKLYVVNNGDTLSGTVTVSANGNSATLAHPEYGNMSFTKIEIGTGDGDGDGDGGADLVGEWLVSEDNSMSSQDMMVFLIFKSSGELCIGGFQSIADNIWLEVEDDDCMGYRVSGSTISIEMDGIGMFVPMGNYSISGNTLTVSPSAIMCDINDEPCEPISAVRSSRAEVKATLGTVYSQDPALYYDPNMNDLAWRLSTDPSETLDFDAVYFYDGYYYLDEYIDYNEKMWYTDGTRVFLLWMDGGYDWENDTYLPYTIVKNVELDYAVTTSGGQKTLSTRLVLEDGTLGDEDVWTPFDVGDDWYAPKALEKKQTKKAGNLKKVLFAQAGK